VLVSSESQVLPAAMQTGLP
jgi:hypothetical protein